MLQPKKAPAPERDVVWYDSPLERKRKYALMRAAENSPRQRQRLREQEHQEQQQRDGNFPPVQAMSPFQMSASQVEQFDEDLISQFGQLQSPITPKSGRPRPWTNTSSSPLVSTPTPPPAPRKRQRSPSSVGNFPDLPPTQTPPQSSSSGILTAAILLPIIPP